MKKRKQNKKSNVVAIFGAIALSVSLSFTLGDSSYADLGAPYRFEREREVYVSNQEGADLKYHEYDYETHETHEITEHVPYGTKLNATYSTDSDLSVRVEKKDDNHNIYTINKNDIKYVKEVFDLNSIQKSEVALSLHTFDGGACLYNGPDDSYGRVEDNYCLDSGVNITSWYYDDIWIFVEKDGHSGWAYYGGEFGDGGQKYTTGSSQKTSFAFVSKSRIDYGSFYIVSEDMVLFDAPRDGKAVYRVKTEELDEIVYDYYYYNYPSSRSYYVNIGGVSGWVYDSVSKIFSDYRKNEVIKLTKDAEVQNSFNNPTEKDIIPAGEKLNVLHRLSEKGVYGSCYVKSDNYEGWITEFAQVEDSSDNIWFEIVDYGEYIDTKEVKTDKTSNPDREVEPFSGEVEYLPEAGEETEAEEPERYFDPEDQKEENTSEENVFLWLIAGFSALAVAIILFLIIAMKNKKSKQKKDAEDIDNNLEKPEEKEKNVDQNPDDQKQDSVENQPEDEVEEKEEPEKPKEE